MYPCGVSVYQIPLKGSVVSYAFKTTFKTPFVFVVEMNLSGKSTETRVSRCHKSDPVKTLPNPNFALRKQLWFVHLWNVSQANPLLAQREI